VVVLGFHTIILEKAGDLQAY